MSEQGLRQTCVNLAMNGIILLPGLGVDPPRLVSLCYADAYPMYEMEANENTRVAVREVAGYFATGATFTCAHERGADHGVGTGTAHFFAEVDVVGRSGTAAVEYLVERFPVHELEMHQTETDEYWVYFYAGLMEYQLRVRRGQVVQLRYGTSGP